MPYGNIWIPEKTITTYHRYVLNIDPIHVDHKLSSTATLWNPQPIHGDLKPVRYSPKSNVRSCSLHQNILINSNKKPSYVTLERWPLRWREAPFTIQGTLSRYWTAPEFLFGEQKRYRLAMCMLWVWQCTRSVILRLTSSLLVLFSLTL